jgi:organic hydroperoxide reductase OsmC/OhrA
MGRYTATAEWQRGDAAFVDQRYSRRHTLRFDGGAELPASSSTQNVPLPMSDPAAVDPEELFVASLASCHLLWFLGIAAGRGFRVDRYQDDADGTLAKDAAGRLVMTVVTLRPRVEWSGDAQPSAAEVDAMHHEAHQRCFIANSVTTDVRCEPVPHPPRSDA